MRKLLANSDYISTIDIQTGVNVTGIILDIGIPSTKVKAKTKGVLKDGYEISVSGIIDSGAGATIPDPNTYNVTYSATATKNKAEGDFILREDDETAIINATPKIPNPGGSPIDSPVEFKYVITDAGQDKVLGE